MTQDQLAQALAESGRSVSTRALKDWRRRGLLPPLASRSRGRGKGIERYWRSSTIFLRAAVAHDLMARREIGDEALFHLAAAGYLVEPETLRAAWISRLDRQARFLQAAGRRRKDGVDGLLEAVPPDRVTKDIPNKAELAGFLQLFWELQRVYVTGEPIDEDELYGLADEAVQPLGLGPLGDKNIDLAEKLVGFCQVFVDRDFERHMVESASREALRLSQIVVNRCYRTASEVLRKTTKPSPLTPEGIVLHTLGIGGFLLKASLYVCDLAPNDRALVGSKRIERWAKSSEFAPLRDGEPLAMPTQRTRARLRRTMREIFND